MGEDCLRDSLPTLQFLKDLGFVCILKFNRYISPARRTNHFSLMSLNLYLHFLNHFLIVEKCCQGEQTFYKMGSFLLSLPLKKFGW